MIFLMKQSKKKTCNVLSRLPRFAEDEFKCMSTRHGIHFLHLAFLLKGCEILSLD